MFKCKLGFLRDNFKLDVKLSLPRQKTLAVIGENGSGKTTLVWLIMGLLKPNTGFIAIDNEFYVDLARGIYSPIKKRPFGLVFQHYSLFSHLSVRENLIFGLKRLRLSKKEIEHRSCIFTERFGLKDLLHRPSSTLSGGQKQRLAIARTLILKPKLMLLDEPFAAIDQQTKTELMSSLNYFRDDMSLMTIIITHNFLEALTLGDMIAVMDSGILLEVGTKEELLSRPKTEYVAHLIGLNLFKGSPAQNAPIFHTDLGSIVTAGIAKNKHYALINPREITIHLKRPDSSALNVLEGYITNISPLDHRGELVRISISSSPPVVSELTTISANALNITVGQKVFASFKAASVNLY